MNNQSKHIYIALRVASESEARVQRQ